MDISASTQTDADENVSCGYPSKQEDYEQNGVCRPGGVRDEGAIGTHTSNDNILCKPLSKATSDDLCNPPNNLVDDIHSPRANPQMDGHENGSSGYATNQEDCEPNEVAKSGEAGDDCSIRTHTSNDNNICDTLSKLAINGHKSVDDLYKPPASAQIDVDESRSCGYPSKLKNLNQNGVVNGRAAGDDCCSETHTGNHNNICDPPSKPNINEYMLVDDLCNPPGNPQMDADENGPGGCPSKQENCKQHKVTKPERAGDDCSIGTLSSNSIAHNVGSSASKSTVHGYSYKLVDDFIFSDRSLIGKFTRLRPSIQELSQWSNVNWSSKMRSIWMFKMIGHGFYKIEFFGQEDCDFVLENGPWFMGVAGLSLKRWSPDFDPQNPGPLKTPIWMSLFDLPLEFCNEDSLIKICSKVGKVLQIAESTTEMNGGTTAARVCVEVDLKEGLLASIDLHCSGNSLTQDLDYEGIPFRCKICRSSEHLDGSCPRKSAKNARKKK